MIVYLGEFEIAGVPNDAVASVVPGVAEQAVVEDPEVRLAGLPTTEHGDGGLDEAVIGAIPATLNTVYCGEVDGVVNGAYLYVFYILKLGKSETNHSKS